MKKGLILVAALLVWGADHAQKHAYTLVNRAFQEDAATGVIHMDERDADGIAWIKDETFTEGTIEFDAKGKDILQRSFVGFAFHGVNDSTFEAVYFRAFNFRNSDVARQAHAVQYVALPGYDWQRLRTEHPGVYEQAISPAPDPNGWFHVRIDVRAEKIRVYVNGNTKPSLVVTPLVATRGRQLGYWVGNGSGGEWKNLKITRYAAAQIRVEGGTISGVDNATGDVRIYEGIPFAAPPVGELRWKAPQPVKPWNGVKVCDRFGPSPVQGKPVPFSMWTKEFLIPDTPISEDCLYLNVWTGAQASTERRPVLVWIYGGGFGSGGAGCPIYDGEAMAQKGIIFVSINYRVGIFGFFAHPELTVESGHHASGNYGLMDQIAALRWVQRNITAFGGDPGKVTIAGQSAGSMSVSCLVASPQAKGLFERAIGESGAMFGPGVVLGNAEVEGQKVLDALKVRSIKELRAVPGEQLMKQTMGIRGPIIDGYVLPEAVADIFAAGRENKVSLLTGWNEDEFGAAPKRALEFQREAGVRYGKDSTTFLQWYPASTDSEATVSARRLSRDLIFGVQNYAWAKVTGRQGNAVYVYRFTRKVPARGEYVKYGAFHTGEVPYVFDNLRFVDRPWLPEDRVLAGKLSDYWANFVKTGDPNGSALPRWAPFKTPDDPILVLDVKLAAEPLPDKGALEFLYQRQVNK